MNRQHLLTMFSLQNELNAKINPAWIHAEYPWHRAIWMEAAEGLEHIGWKWWKGHNEAIDIAQIQIELVDIWHFGMSLLLVTLNGDIDKAVDTVLEYFEKLEADPDAMGPIRTLSNASLFELLAGSAALQRQLNGPAFNMLLVNFELSWNKLYAMYIAKNVLNTFRQKHGYKAGTYRKIWDGREDNVVLAELMGRYPHATPELLDDHLEAAYGQLNP